MARTNKGDVVENTVPIHDRDAFFKEEGKPGKTTVSFDAGEQHRAATDELGGNIWVDAQVQNDDVVVPLGEGEWRPA